MTTDQIIAETKTVTRRFGWWFLKPGDRVCAVEKSQGLKKGEKIRRLKTIEIVSTRTEPLHCITKSDCVLEGFPEMSPIEFTVMLMNHYGCMPSKTVNRIEFKYIESEGGV